MFSTRAKEGIATDQVVLLGVGLVALSPDELVELLELLLQVYELLVLDLVVVLPEDGVLVQVGDLQLAVQFALEALDLLLQVLVLDVDLHHLVSSHLLALLGTASWRTAGPPLLSHLGYDLGSTVVLLQAHPVDCRVVHHVLQLLQELRVDDFQLFDASPVHFGLAQEHFEVLLVEIHKNK